MTIRTAAITITRVNENPETVRAFAEDGVIIGKANNIVLPRVTHPHTDYFGEIGTEPDWDRTVALTQFTFDLMEASEAPESLGPIELYFDVDELMTDGRTKRHRVGARIQDMGGTFNRGQEYPRSLTLTPFLLIEGGGKSLAPFDPDDEDHHTFITKPEPGTAADNVAFLYCRLRADGADAAEYITRRPGQAPVRHLPLANGALSG